MFISIRDKSVFADNRKMIGDAPVRLVAIAEVDWRTFNYKVLGENGVAYNVLLVFGEAMFTPLSNYELEIFRVCELVHKRRC